MDVPLHATKENALNADDSASLDLFRIVAQRIALAFNKARTRVDAMLTEGRCIVVLPYLPRK